VTALRDVESLDLRSRWTESLHSLLHHNAGVCARFPEFRGCLARNATDETGVWRSSCEQYVAYLRGTRAAPVFIDPGSVDGAAPGLLFNRSHSYPVIKAGHHWRLRTWEPCTSVLRTPEVLHHHAFATVVQEFPCTVAHMLYETLPKFALLLRSLDAQGLLGRVPFLLPACALGMRRMFDEVMSPEQRRTARLNFTWTPAKRHGSTVGVYQVGYVGAFESTFEREVWTKRSGGSPPLERNSLGWCPSCAALRHASHQTLKHADWYKPAAATGTESALRCKILVLQRSGRNPRTGRAVARSISNLNEVLGALSAEFPRYHVSSFAITQARSPQRDMHDAAVLVAPHGAGLANVFFLPHRAIVTELAFTARGGVEFPVSYYHLWSHACRLTHTLALANGSYSTPMRADTASLRAVLRHAIQQSPAHAHCSGDVPDRKHRAGTRANLSLPVLLHGRYSAGVR